MLNYLEQSEPINIVTEQVEEVSRRKLIVPVCTRWNSLHQAISRVITMPLNELNQLCVKLGIKCLTDRKYHTRVMYRDEAPDCCPRQVTGG